MKRCKSQWRPVMNRKHTKHPTPYVSAEAIDGRLVRLCPECNHLIGERTDSDGVVSNHFAEHYEAEHREQEPERTRYYVLGCQPRDGGPGPEVCRNVSRLALEWVEKQFPELDWELVDRIEDLPERASVLQASHVVVSGITKDPRERQIRWYRREEERGFVFTPTKKQVGEYDLHHDHARNVRRALIERHRDELPVFTGKTLKEWENDHLPKRRQIEDQIAKGFDAQREIAAHQFWVGDYQWLETYQAAIAALGIPEEEVEELRVRDEAQLAEAMRQNDEWKKRQPKTTVGRAK